MDITELVVKAMKATGTTSYRQLGERVGVTHTAIGKWLDGSQLPTFETCAHLAELAGLDAVKVAATIRLQAKDAAKNRGTLRRIAQAAAIVVALGLVALPPAVYAAGDIHYAKLRRLFRSKTENRNTFNDLATCQF